MPINFLIKDHIIMPFGCEKWHIDLVDVSGITTEGTYFTSKTSCAYIDKNKNGPLRLNQFREFFPEEKVSHPEIEDAQRAFQFIKHTLKEKCMVSTVYEKRFLDIYFEYIDWYSEKYIQDSVDYFSWWEQANYHEIQSGDVQRIEYLMLFLHLMPFPQAHIYVHDPFVEEISFNPNRMLRVDFAFWTGKNFVAIEIDGKSHVGSFAHVEKDRLLGRAGVFVIHILNEEIEKYGTRLISKLLPNEISKLDYIDLMDQMKIRNLHSRFDRVNSLFNPFSKW